MAASGPVCDHRPWVAAPIANHLYLDLLGDLLRVAHFDPSGNVQGTLVRFDSAATARGSARSRPSTRDMVASPIFVRACARD